MPTQNDCHTISDLYQMQSLPLEIKVRMTQRRIRDWVEYWGEDGVYVSFSGGKDSTVLLDICRRMYPNIVAVYSDTGLEFPEIREFVKAKDNVVWVRPELTFRKVIEKCGYPCISKEQAEWIHRIRLGQKNTRDIQKYFYGIRTNGQPSRFKISERWKFMLNAPFDIGAGCCNEMKKKPIAKYAKETGRVPIVGTMACESSLRTSNWLRYGCNAYDNKKATSAPLSFWTDADIWEYIRTYDIPYCKIYDMGYVRTGCIFCMFGVHLDSEPNRFQRLQRTHPQLWRYCMKPWDKGGLGMREVLEYMKYTPIGISPEQAQFLETRKFQINEIARIFRVPPHMVGDLEKSSFSNIEQQSLEFVKYTLDPWVIRWEQSIQRSLLSKDEKAVYFVKFNLEGLLRGDYQSRMNGYAIGRQNGWMSANDIRELENLDRIPEENGGDLYLINGNMLPLKNAGAFANTPTDDGKEEETDEEVLELEEPDGNELGDAGTDTGKNPVPERDHRRGKLV